MSRNPLVIKCEAERRDESAGTAPTPVAKSITVFSPEGPALLVFIHALAVRLL